jgi:hypothetical protein
MNIIHNKEGVTMKATENKAVLVYQAGIANVFKVQSFNLADYGRDAIRLVQGDFESCKWYARGVKKAGWTVKVLGCNMAGDITHMLWTDNLEELPFSDKFVKTSKFNDLEG